MEPTTIILGSLLIGKILDELAAKSKNKKLKKYIGILSWIARIPKILVTGKSKF